MNDQRFDAFSRRDLLRAAGFGGAAIFANAVASGGTAAARRALPNGQGIQSRAPGAPTTEDTAWELDLDPERIFRFVADEIAYEAYPGVLRGAKGALWGLSGNSVDQALLLAELLKQALVPVRFVVGELDDAGAGELLDSMRLDIMATRAEAERVRASGRQAFDQHPGLTAEQHAVLQSPEELRRQLLDLAQARVDTDVRTIEEAIARAQTSLPEPEFALPVRERRQHVWIQYAAGPEWIDLDPSFPGAEPGTAYAEPAETWDAIPDDLFHQVRIRAVVEANVGGEPVRQDALTFEARCADLVGVPLVFTHGDATSFEGLGLSISGLLGGTLQYVPILLAGDVGESGTVLTFGSGDGALDVFGASEVDGEAIAEWLEIEVLVPDEPMRLTRREIFDRIGVDKRTEELLDLSTLEPVELIDVPELGRVFLPLETIWVMSVVGQRIPGSYFEQDYAVEDIQADLALAVHGYNVLRDTLHVEIASERGYRAYLDQPNVTAITMTPVQAGDQGFTPSIAMDLLHQGSGVVPVDGTTPVVQPQVLAGVLAHAAERLAIESGAELSPHPPIPVASVGRVFEEAEQQDIAIRSLLPETTDLSELDVSDVAKVRIAGALADGYVVIVPERAVSLDGQNLVGWWQVDPVTGVTFDLMEHGRGAASPMGGYLVIVVNGVIIVKVHLFYVGMFISGVILGVGTALFVTTFW